MVQQNAVGFRNVHITAGCEKGHVEQRRSVELSLRGDQFSLTDGLPFGRLERNDLLFLFG
jgi:hypothetical protein